MNTNTVFLKSIFYLKFDDTTNNKTIFFSELYLKIKVVIHSHYNLTMLSSLETFSSPVKSNSFCFLQVNSFASKLNSQKLIHRSLSVEESSIIISPQVSLCMCIVQSSVYNCIYNNNIVCILYMYLLI